MRLSIFLVSIFSIGMVFNGCNAQKEQPKESESMSQEVSFFGQKPPGLTPELFAPGIVSTENLEMPTAFDPKEDEFYFIRQMKGEAPKTHVFQFSNGTWQESILEDALDGFISPDAQTLYQGNEYRERTDTGWSEKKSLGPFFDKFPIMSLTVSSSNTYVFDERDSIGTLRYSRLIEGKREEPQAFGKEINTGKWTAHPFIAPDESYLIWDSEREGGFGETDLYISFRQEDGSWGTAINMGKDINTEFEDGGGKVTPDGKYFFYNTINLGESFEESKANIFWVDAQIIEDLKHKRQF